MLSDILNYRQVTPLLATSGQPDEQELAAIAAQGYATVINIALHNDPRYSLVDERATVESLGMEYIHIPVQFAAPTDQDLSKFFAAVEEQADAKTWVHCAANKRVSTFLGLYWHLRCKQPVHEAFALQREIWTPDETWQYFIARHLSAAGDV